jgi:hypothetical protein
MRQLSHVNSDSQSNQNSIGSQHSRTTTSSLSPEWSGVNMQVFQANNMKNVILLDSQSTLSLFVSQEG